MFSTAERIAVLSLGLVRLATIQTHISVRITKTLIIGAPSPFNGAFGLAAILIFACLRLERFAAYLTPLWFQPDVRSSYASTCLTYF